MGTIYDQTVRNQHHLTLDGLEETVIAFRDMARGQQVSLADVIATAAYMEQERASSIACDDGDIHDEQMMGIANCLDGIAGALEHIAEATHALGIDIHNEIGQSSLGKCVLEVAAALKEKAPPASTDEA